MLMIIHIDCPNNVNSSELRPQRILPCHALLVCGRKSAHFLWSRQSRGCRRLRRNKTAANKCSIYYSLFCVARYRQDLCCSCANVWRYRECTIWILKVLQSLIGFIFICLKIGLFPKADTKIHTVYSVKGLNCWEANVWACSSVMAMSDVCIIGWLISNDLHE